jgi:hypothetical protein
MPSVLKLEMEQRLLSSPTLNNKPTLPVKLLMATSSSKESLTLLDFHRVVSSPATLLRDALSRLT